MAADHSRSFPAEACQPQSATFPKIVFGKASQRKYSFQAKWFDSWRWLHWADSKKMVFCHTCASTWHAGKLTFSKNIEATFIDKGFQNWKDATRIFRDHEKSKCHTEAVERMLKLPATTPDVGEMLVGQLAEQKKHNRKMLLHVIRSVHFLARQGLALRGITSTSDSASDAVSEPDSNLHQLLELVSSYDPRVADWVRKKTNQYTSPDMCNELLAQMAHTILRKIACSIRGRMFTIMVDETTDNSTTEQCVLVLRWVDDELKTHEDLIGLHDTPAANAGNTYSQNHSGCATAS
jgi:hypothetical protein